MSEVRGEGGADVVEVDEAATVRARRRRRRAAVTLTVLVVFLLGAFATALAYVRADVASPSAPPPSSSRTCPAGGVPPGRVRLNVYNSTDRRGLAAKTAKELRRRGYAVEKVANDPRGRTVKGVARIRSGPRGRARAAAVRQVVPGARLFVDHRTGTRVDLVLGLRFTTLGPPPGRGCRGG